MTSREHARRLMLILLSSPEGPESSTDEAGEGGEQRQIPEASDDSPESDERRTTALVEALALT